MREAWRRWTLASALWLGALAWAQPRVEEGTRFLVKLGDTLDTRISRAGDRVSAVVISPVSLRGGRLEGQVEEASGPRLRFGFHTLRLAGHAVAIRTEITGVVNSKGNPARDDLNQVVRIEKGTVIAPGEAVAIHEGAEIRLVGGPR
ncbi:MAG: hypothetical protein RMI94_02845 [Bryobacterales bacterium]|nr:hypothetical protein [Bryobacteraceae bacterium]MDW8129458.1 hypothetical protein [Bryobacterales bacterium]